MSNPRERFLRLGDPASPLETRLEEDELYPRYRELMDEIEGGLYQPPRDHVATEPWMETEAGMTEPQRLIYGSQHRFVWACCGRGMGKSWIARFAAASEAAIPDSSILILAPFFHVVKRLYWHPLLTAFTRGGWLDPARPPSANDMTMWLVNGTRVRFAGADRPEGLLGDEFDFSVCDEISSYKASVLDEYLAGCLARKNVRGRMLAISSPRGLDTFYDGWLAAQSNPESIAWQFVSTSGGNVTEHEALSALRRLDLDSWRQEFGSVFSARTGAVFSRFTMEGNVRPHDLDLEDRHLYVGMDFNIGRMAAVVMAQRGLDWHVIDEIVQRTPGSDTDSMAQEIKSRYPDHWRGHMTVIPDASGASRKTSAGGRTDVTLLESHGFTVESAASNPGIVDSVNLANSLMCSASGERRLYIDPGCKALVGSLMRLVWAPESSTAKIADSEDKDVADAMRYCLWARQSFRTLVGADRWDPPMPRSVGI